MTLYLVRHAEAKPLGTAVATDAARPLTAEGEQHARLMGRLLARIEGSPPLIAHSPYVRAAHTAALLNEARADAAPQEAWDELAPGVRYKELLARIGRTPVQALVLVGHQPDMTNVLAGLVADAAAEIAMPPAAIACVSLAPGITSTSGRLHWLLTPELVRTVAPAL